MNINKSVCAQLGPMESDTKLLILEFKFIWPYTNNRPSIVWENELNCLEKNYTPTILYEI